MADYRYCVGTVPRILAPGQQTCPVEDDCGPFTPKVVLVWSTFAGDGAAADGRLSLGFSNGVDVQRVTSSYKGNAQSGGPRATRSYTSDLWALAFSTSSPTVVGNAGILENFQEGSFDIDWDSNDGTAIDVHYLAIGGDDLEVWCGTIAAPAADGVQVTTGMGIGQVTGLIVLPTWAISDVSMGVTTRFIDDFPAIGWGAASDQQGALSTHVDAIAFDIEYTYRVLSTQHVGLWQGWGGDYAINGEVAIQSLDVGGVTLNWANTPYPGYGGNAVVFPQFNAGLYAIAIAGPRVKVGTLQQPTAVGDQTIDDVGFVPGTVLFTSVGAVPNGSVESDLRWMLGAANGLANVVGWLADQNGVEPTVATSSMLRSTSLLAADPAGASLTTLATATLSLTADGFTLSWSLVDSVAREILYIAFEAGTDALGSYCVPVGATLPDGCTVDFPKDAEVSCAVALPSPDAVGGFGGDRLIFSLRPDSPISGEYWIQSDDGEVFTALSLPAVGIDGTSAARFTCTWGGGNTVFFWVSRGALGTDPPVVYRYDGGSAAAMLSTFPLPSGYPSDALPIVPQLRYDDLSGLVYVLVGYYTLPAGVQTGQGSTIFTVDPVTGITGIPYEALVLLSGTWQNTLPGTFLLPEGVQSTFPCNHPVIVGHQVNIGSATGIWEYIDPTATIGAIFVPGSGSGSVRSPGLSVGQFATVGRWVRTYPAVNGEIASAGAVQEMVAFDGNVFLATGGITTPNIAYILRRSYSQDAGTSGIWTGIDPSLHLSTYSNQVTQQGTITGGRFSRFFSFGGTLFCHYRDTNSTGTALILKYVPAAYGTSDEWTPDVDLLATFPGEVLSTHLPGQPVEFLGKLYLPMLTGTANTGYLLVRDSGGAWTRTQTGTGFYGPGGLVSRNQSLVTVLPNSFG